MEQQEAMQVELTPYDGPTDFVHLHCHTLYSILDGAQSCEQVFQTCKERKWPAIAITEHGNLASMPDNYAASCETGVKYIVACEIYYNDNELKRQQLAVENIKIGTLKVHEDPVQRDLHSRMTKNRHLTVLAKNKIGVENLIKLTTQAFTTGFYYKPRIWFDKLSEYREGLTVLSGCLNGPVAFEIRQGNYNNHPNGSGAIEYVKKFKEIFGDDYSIEMQMPCLAELNDFKVFWDLNNLANKFKLRKTLTNDAHYLDRRDFEVQKLMMAIDQGLTIDDPDLFHVNSDEQYLKTRAELYHTFKTNKYSERVTDREFEEMCDGTLDVASRCDTFNPDKASKVPTFTNDNEELKRKVLQALINKNLHRDKTKYIIDNRSVTYLEQVQIELNRFIEKNFASYFLITQDLIQFSLSKGYPVGPRGSVGGSLVCYLLGITELDPLKWRLSFNRFLSPSRGGKMLKIKAE